MLKLFRQRKLIVRILFWVIVLVVGLMMVVTLVPGLGQADLSLSDPQGVLARVGGVPVTQNQALREYQRRVQQLGTDSPQFRQFLLQGIVEDLITQQVVEYEAQRLGFQATPEEVRLHLRQLSLFYPGGEFVGSDLYQQIVQTELRMSVPEFERQLQRQAVLSKLFLWVTGGLAVSPAEVELEYRRRTETAKIEYVVFRPDAYARQLQPTPEALQGYYEANRARYQLPERRAVRFVPIDTDVLSRRVEVSPEELEDYYQRNRENYRLPERVRARHILFLRQGAGTVPTEQSGEEASEGSQPDALRQQAEEVLAQLRGGASFAALAEEHSADEATRGNGGEIGWVQRGQTVPALEKVLFSVPSGSPPELVETSYGFHIVQVLERQAERLRPLAEVRAEIEPGLKQQKVEEEAIAQARAIVEAVRAGKSLQEAAQENGWPLQESPSFSRTETLAPFGNDREFQEAAFRLPAASAGQAGAPVSDPVTVPAGYAVLQLKEVSPAHQASFEEVRDQVEAAYRQERGAELAREAAQRLAEDARASGGLREAARGAGLEVTTSESFGRLGSLPGIGSVRDIASQAFSLPVGETSPPILAAGNWVVIRLLERQDADLTQIPPEEYETISDFLLGQKRNLTWSIFTESLKKRLLSEGELHLNQAAIDRLTGQS